MVFEVEVDEAGIGRRRGGWCVPMSVLRPDASCLRALCPFSVLLGGPWW